jgi:hypothetical protein
VVKTHVDHFMYAVPDLDDGIAWATAVFGAAPAYGGEHVGLGTRNALLSLGDSYLEIIAPDPAQTLTGTFGETLANLSAPGLASWAARGALGPVRDALAARGIASRGPQRTQRQTAQGELLAWELLFPVARPGAPRLPFFIDWLDCPHPSVTAPAGGSLESFTLSSPEPEALAEILESLRLAVPVSAGNAGLQVTVKGKRGVVTLTSTEETLASTPG